MRSFFYYFILLTLGFILLFEVFTFFDLLDDIAHHRTGLVEVVTYFADRDEPAAPEKPAPGKASAGTRAKAPAPTRRTG